MPGYVSLLYDLQDDVAELADILDNYRRGKLPQSEPSTLAIITLTVLSNVGRMLKEGSDTRMVGESYRQVLKGYHTVLNLALGLAVGEDGKNKIPVEERGYITEELEKILERLRGLHADITFDPTGYSLVDFAHGFVTRQNPSPRYVDGANAAVSKYERVYEAALKRLNSPNDKPN